MNETPTTLRSTAAAHDQAAADSFDRCDTDGFLSQWAHGIESQRLRRSAEIADHDGLWTFERFTLVRLDGSETDARAVNTRYGRKWRLDSTDQWLPFNPARESTLAKRGYREVVETIVAPAKAILDAPRGARGTGGATSVYVRIIRADLDGGEAFSWSPVCAPE